MVFFHIISVIFLGAVLGSFATAIAHRSAKGGSWADQLGLNNPRSVCPECGQVLRPAHMIPLYSWWRLKGRCGHCNTRISAFYPLTELSVLALCLLVYGMHGFTAESVLMMLAVPFLVALFVVDIRRMILPNVLVFCFAVIGGVYLGLRAAHAPYFDTLLMEHMGGALLYGALLYMTGKLVGIVLKKDALGFGDVKFFAASGLWLGAGLLGHALIISGVLGVAFAAVWQWKTGARHFPFGPALIAATFLLMLIGSSL